MSSQIIVREGDGEAGGIVDMSSKSGSVHHLMSSSTSGSLKTVEDNTGSGFELGVVDVSRKMCCCRGCHLGVLVSSSVVYVVRHKYAIS